jgi:membrane fusion protein, multidrug efflux system
MDKGSEAMNDHKPDYLIARREYLCRVLPVLILAISFLISGCSPKKKSQTPAGLPVKTAVVSQKDVPVKVSAIGTVKPYSVVNIISLVDGRIVQIHVQEGQMVEKGQTLFNIDDQPFQDLVESSRSNLSRDQINLEMAKKDAQRYAELLVKDFVTKDQAEQAQTNADALQATVKGDQAALKNAELNLSYCRITAPITGRAGAILVNQGNIIKGNDSTKPLMVINQIQPVYVQFSVPEQLLAQIQTQSRINEPKVTASLPENPGDAKEGRLTFLDNAVDATTGTIDLKATFDNPDNSLWPGQFVNVVLMLGVQKDALVVPSAAVQIGQNGHYVFIVKKDNTVEARDVTPGLESDNQIVIVKGLLLNETVVTDGTSRLSQGARVVVKNDIEAGAEARK